MLLAPSCVPDFAVISAGKTFDRVRHPVSATDRCDSCNVMPGGIIIRPCPNCGGQLTTCIGRNKDEALRAVAVSSASYEPVERYILFELDVTEARCNGYGDVTLPSPTHWRSR
jgi:hypothetical protein